MKRLKKILKTTVPLSIVTFVLLVMFEVVHVPVSASQWFVLIYLSVILTILTAQIFLGFTISHNKSEDE